MISRKGNIKKDLAIMFNHGDIGEIVCRGYEDDSSAEEIDGKKVRVVGID